MIWSMDQKEELEIYMSDWHYLLDKNIQIKQKIHMYTERM